MDGRDRHRALLQGLGPAARGWRQAADAALAGLGVSGSAGWCLVYLDSIGAVPRQAALAQALEVSAPALVRTLDQLQRAGWIARTADPDDGRSNRVTLTPVGRTMAARIQARLDMLGDDILGGLPVEAVEIGIELLHLLNVRLGEERLARPSGDGVDDPRVDAQQ